MAINTPLPVRALAFAAAALVSVCAAAQDVSSSSHPSASYWYIDTTFDAEWPDYEPGAAGFRWLIDGVPDTAVTTGNSTATSNRSLSDGPHAHGTWYFHLAAVDGGGNVLPDTQADFQFHVLDEAPGVTSSSHPAADPANYERDFTATLSAPAEVTEGSVTGYRALVDESPSTAPGVDDTLYDTQPITIAGNAPGEHWFHGAAVDRLGNISTPVHHAFEVLSDAPVISSPTHPTQNEGYPAKDIIFNWDDPAGMPEDLVDRYLYVFDDSPGTVPRASANATEQQNQTIGQVSIGTHYFHVRSQDVYGYLSPTAHYRVIVSQAAAPVVSSSTHPDPTQDYATRDVTFEWTDPDSSSQWYYYVLDKNSDTLPEITDTQVLGRTTEISGLADGAYWFHVRGEDVYGNLTKTGHFRVNVVDGYIDTDFSADTTAGNAPLTVNFTGTADESPIDSWSWDFGDGETGAGQNPSHVYDAAGRYTVILETTAGDRIGYVEKTEHITVSDTVAADFTASPTTGQPPLTVEFSDSSDGLLDTWEWDFDDDGAIDATGPTPFYTFEAPGSYDVTLSVSGDDGSDSTTKPGFITVEPYDPPTVNFTGSPTSGERPLTVAFSNATTGQVDSWAWDFDGDGVTDSELELPDPYTYDDPDVYTVTLSATGPGGSDDLTRTDYITVEGIPAEAAFSATPLEGLAPLEVQFTDESTGDIDYWEWDLDGDGFSDSNAQSPSYTYDEPGTYNVSLLVEGDGGTDTENKANYITVLEPADADFTATPTQGVAPLAVDFANASSGDIVAYEWDFDGDGAFDSTEENPSHTYPGPGLYTVSLRVTGPNGEDTETKTDYIEVYAPAEANFSGAPLEGPAPLTVQFTDASAGDIVTYEWDLDGDGSFDDSTESNPAFTYDAPGQYAVALRVSGDGGTDTETKSDYVTVYEPAEAGFSAAPTQGIAPLPVSFTNESSGEIVRYEWDFDGDGAFDSTEESPSHTYGEAGTFTVTLSVSGPGGEDTETQTGFIQVYAPAEADFSAFPLDGVAPLTVQFTDLSDGDVDAYAWDLDGDGENDSALRDPSFVYDTPGVYDVTLSVAGDGGEDTESKPGYITVYAPSVAGFVADATEGEAPFTVTFTNNSSGDYTAAEWDFDGDGAADSMDAGAQVEFIYDTPGQYDVALTVSGPGGTDTLTRPDYIMVNRPPNQPPVAEVAETEIFLTSLSGMALLDGSPSSDPDGDALFYSWREGESNPCHGLLPPESESLAAVPLHFDTPGQYVFELRVSDGDLMSASTRTVTVLVPGVNGVLDWAPSDGLAPLAGARLAAYGSEADAESGANPLDAAVSDAYGSVSLRHVGPQDQSTGRDYWVVPSRLSFPSAAPQLVTVVPDPGAEDAQRRFSLPRGSLTSLTGTVFDQADAAIENANLFLLPGLGAQGFSALTDAAGGYALTELPLGPWVMQLRGPAGAYMPETRLIGLGSGRGPLDLHLTPSTGRGAVTGRVTAAATGLPIEDATVSLGTAAAAQTSATGTYVIPNAQAGSYALYVTKDGYKPLRHTPVRVAAGLVTQRDAVLKFAQCGYTVLGLILDGENGDPVRDATVGVVRGGILVARDATDATGFFQLTGVSAGSHEFQVTAPGYEPLSFTETITGSTRLDDTDIVHAPSWQDRMTPQDPLAPRAAVADTDIYLQTMSRSATLDASPSHGEGLTYLWHENPGNPATGLVPAGSETAATVDIDGFPRPGVYHFHVRVTDGVRLSPNTAAVSVYVPGLAGHVHAAGSGGYLRIANAQVRAYETYAGAAAWAANGVTDSALSSSDPLGAYTLDQLPAGAYWIVAHGPPDSAYETFGPVLRHSGYGAASSHAAVALQRPEHAVEGVVTDSVTGLPVEGVRVALDPATLGETLRTSTDASGYYRIELAPQGDAVPLTFWGDGYAARTDAVDISGELNHDAQVSPSDARAQLHGYVTVAYDDLSLPVQGAEVILGSGLARAYTNAAGYYQFDSLPTGNHYAVVVREGYLPRPLASSEVFPLADGDNVIDCELEFQGDGPSLSGLLLDEAGEPLPGANVVPDTPAKAAPVPVDDAGVFSLSGLAHGPQRLLVQPQTGDPFVAVVNVTGSMAAVLGEDQLAGGPAIGLTPQTLELPAAAGQTSVEVANTGAGVLNWTAQVTSGGDWLSIESGATGTDAEAITLNYAANASETARTATLEVASGDADNSPQSVSLSQAGTPLDPVLEITPVSRAVSADGGTTTFDVRNAGALGLSWTASVIEGGSWLSITAGSSGSENGLISVDAAANANADARTATIRVSAPGAIGSPAEVTVEQEGRGGPILSVSPLALSVGNQAGSATVSVANDGAGQLNWTAEVVLGASWVFLDATEGAGAAELAFSYLANDGPEREARIRLTAANAQGSPQTVVLTQAESPTTTPFLEVAPDSRTVPAAGGAPLFEVRNTGGGELSWSAQVTQGGAWLSITSGANGTGDGSLTASAAANTGGARTGAIEVTADGAGGSPVTVLVEQAGQGQPVAILEVAPLFLEADLRPGSRSFTVTNAGESALSWTAEVVLGGDWASIDAAQGQAGDTVTLSFDPNPGEERTAQVRITAAGAADSPQTVQLTQRAYSREEAADVNNDDAINAIDLQLVIRAIFQLEVQNAYPDVNLDGSVNSIDLQLVILGIFGLL